LNPPQREGETAALRCPREQAAIVYYRTARLEARLNLDEMMWFAAFFRNTSLGSIRMSM
jgi:hypothetical protein